jgi:membrane protein DedA with SNARE-associated domain
LHDQIHRLVDWYQHSLTTGGYPYIVFLMALESSVVPIPSELIIPPAVLLAMGRQAPMSVAGIVIAAVIGSWIGATVMYWASRLAGRPLVIAYGRYVFIPAAKVEKAERWFQRFGSPGVFLSRMIPVVRHLIGIPAGIMEMNFGKYSLYTFLGSAVWCSILAYISTVAGKDAALMHGEIREVTLWLAGACVILAAVYYFAVHRLTRAES